MIYFTILFFLSAWTLAYLYLSELEKKKVKKLFFEVSVNHIFKCSDIVKEFHMNLINYYKKRNKFFEDTKVNFEFKSLVVDNFTIKQWLMWELEEIPTSVMEKINTIYGEWRKEND